MLDYIQRMLTDLPSDMDGESPTPAANHLFEVSATPEHYLTQPPVTYSIIMLPNSCSCASVHVQIYKQLSPFYVLDVQAPDRDDYKKFDKGHEISPCNRRYATHLGS